MKTKDELTERRRGALMGVIYSSMLWSLSLPSKVGLPLSLALAAITLFLIYKWE